MGRVFTVIKGNIKIKVQTDGEPWLIMDRKRYIVMFGLLIYATGLVAGWGSFFTLLGFAIVGAFLGEFLYRKTLNYFVGKSIFYKSLLQSTIEVFYYYPFHQIAVTVAILLGTLAQTVSLRRDLLLIGKQSINSNIQVRKYFIRRETLNQSAPFPGIISAVFYDKHLPVPFLPFQVDRQTLATSMHDQEFAKRVWKKFEFSGFRTMGWSSNYFLGYQKRILSDKKVSRSDFSDLMRLILASPAGFNAGLGRDRHVLDEFLHGMHSEEFLTDASEGRINFAECRDSEIAFPIIFRQQEGTVSCERTTNSNVISQLHNSDDIISVIFPILIACPNNLKNPEWHNTPIKNVSGFAIGRRNDDWIVIAMSSFSWVRIRPDRLFTLLKPVLEKSNIKLHYYVHTDDGGAVGEQVRVGNNKSLRLSPFVGHGISSLVGFVPVNKVNELNKQLLADAS